MDLALSKTNPKEKYIILSIIVLFAGFFTYYNILFDVALVSFLFLSSFCIGDMFPVKGKAIQKKFIQTALGLGVIGLMIYFVLLFGIGRTSTYLVILATPILFRYKTICNLSKNFATGYRFLRKHVVFILLLICVFLFYSAYSSAPIRQYDDLTKHVPLTLYAARNGKWYTNVVESVVYAECMLMQYTYSAMFATFGAYKALTLFNVVLFFSNFLALSLLLRDIFKKSNIFLFGFLYFTVPMFFKYSSCFSLEVLPLYFLFHAMLCFSSLNSTKAWNNLAYVAFLFGCSLFSKLTTSYTILCVGIIELFLCVYYCIKNHKHIGQTVLKFIACGLIFISPFITSVINMWYWNGNPLMPSMFNEVLISPYYPAVKFVRPFDDQPLGLNFQSLINIVFHTSNNIEMTDGGLGIFLLLLFIIPVAAVIFRKRSIIVWGIVPFVAFQISCLFTYNLRYSMSIFVLFLVLIVASVSMLLSKILHNWTYRIGMVLLIIVLALPNFIYIWSSFPIKSSITPDSDITKNTNRSILKTVPAGKRVFSVNDPFKGDYDGFYSAWMWHNKYNITKIQSGELDLSTYISSFDYVLVNKNLEIPNADLQEIVQAADSENSLLSFYTESDTHKLYKVNKSAMLIKQKQFDSPKQSKTSKPVTLLFKTKCDSYYISQTVENLSDTPVKVRFQINWYDDNKERITTSIQTYMQEKGKKTSISPEIVPPENFAYGVLYITSHNDEDILVHDYQLFGYTDYLSDEIYKYNNRLLLKNRLDQ